MASMVPTPPEGIGPARPLSVTPELVHGALRRTSTIDVTEREGDSGPLHIAARARDTASGKSKPLVTLTATLGSDSLIRSLSVS
ncbi:hypothetical protein, partial [Streptomyces sp. bgisy027]|uniref:hypothetical protein n=1 Tax=Streptomyces sp. bgisy027 TaxID=3413770 RepID=UPI003D72EA50